jgi:uncharacterized protein YcfL
MKKILLLITLITLSYFEVCSAETIESKIDQQGTAKYLNFTGLSARPKNNLLVLNVEVTNKDDRDNKAFYRVRWLDESGDSVWDDQPWKPLLFHGNQKQHLRIVAPTTKAKDFKIEFSAEANWRN